MVLLCKFSVVYEFECIECDFFEFGVVVFWKKVNNMVVWYWVVCCFLYEMMNVDLLVCWN